jgi:hypothetical protein
MSYLLHYAPFASTPEEGGKKIFEACFGEKEEWGDDGIKGEKAVYLKDYKSYVLPSWRDLKGDERLTMSLYRQCSSSGCRVRSGIASSLEELDRYCSPGSQTGAFSLVFKGCNDKEKIIHV